jgi:hypothetical protein
MRKVEMEEKNEKGLQKTIKNQRVLKAPWCPLSGTLPYVENIPSSPQFHFIDIIVKARQLWGVNTDQDQMRFTCDFGKTAYPKLKIKTARTIFECYDSVSLHMIDGYYRTPCDRVIGKHTLATKWREACYFIRGFHLGMAFDFDTQDYEILAILAISIAQLCLEDSEINDVTFLEYALEAQNLLTIATEQKRNQEISSNNAERLRAEAKLEAERLETNIFVQEIDSFLVKLDEKEKKISEEMSTKDSVIQSTKQENRTLKLSAKALEKINKRTDKKLKKARRKKEEKLLKMKKEIGKLAQGVAVSIWNLENTGGYKISSYKDTAIEIKKRLNKIVTDKKENATQAERYLSNRSIFYITGIIKKPDIYAKRPPQISSRKSR